MLERTQSDPHSRSSVSGSRRPRLARFLKAAAEWAAAFSLAAAALPLPAAADWLVTADGERIETKGPWEVRGRLVVYTTPDGTLASLRASRVDLEGSEQATAEAAAEASRPPAESAPEPEERAPVLVLTDRDVARAAPGETGGVETSEGNGEQTPQQSASQPGASSLEVVSYDDRFVAEENELVVTGQLRNRGRSLLTRVFLDVIAYDEGGSVIGRTEATIEAEALRPGESTTFTATFPALALYDRLAFNTASSGFIRGGESTEKAGEEGESGAPPESR